MNETLEKLEHLSKLIEERKDKALADAFCSFVQSFNKELKDLAKLGKKLKSFEFLNPNTWDVVIE